MANTLPAPTEGLVYTNPTTGKRMKFSDGCWKSIDYLPLDGSDSMQGTLWTPDQLINGNTLTADSIQEPEEVNWYQWYSSPSSNANNDWWAITFGDGKFVAVAKRGSKRAMYSTDAINWIGTDIPSSQWYGVTYGNGKFVAVANAGTERVAYSEDGITWTGLSGFDTAQWHDVEYGNGKFVAVAWATPAGSNNDRVMYSVDGINWTPSNADNTNGWASAVYGDDKWVAVAREGTSNKVMYSEDAINWTSVPSVDDEAQWYGVAYGNGKFVAVAYAGTHRIMESTDGINWTIVPPLVTLMWRDIIFAANNFMAIASSGTYRAIFSSDAIYWQETNPGNGGDWMSIAYGNDMFVAVQPYGSGSTVRLPVPDPESDTQDLYFNGDPVVIDTGLQGSLATLLSTQSRKLGRTKYYQDSALPTGDSYDYPDGSLWYQPTSNNLHFYNDSDQTWVQL